MDDVRVRGMDLVMIAPFTTIGAQRAVNLAKHYKNRRVYLMMPSMDRHSKFKIETFTSIGKIRIIRPFQGTQFKSEISLVPYIFTSFYALRKFKDAIFHVSKPNPLTCSSVLMKIWAQFLRKKKIPLVLDIDDRDSAVMQEEGHHPVKIWLIKYFEKKFPQYADKIVTASSYIYHLMKKVNKNTVRIPNGIDVKSATRDATKCQYLKEQYNLNEKVVTYMGNLNQKYLIADFLKALKYITYKKVSFLIIGDGLYRKYFEKLAKKSHRYVNFIGGHPHDLVFDFLTISDIGIAYFPDHVVIKSASNLKVFAYLATKTLPIVSDVGDLPSYVAYGRVGCVVRRSSPKKLARTIDYMLENDKLRKKMCEMGYSYVKSNYDWKVLAEKYEQVYTELETNFVSAS
jgi:glycosyltransferase involved in cell wall biosynthesis